MIYIQSVYNDYRDDADENNLPKDVDEQHHEIDDNDDVLTSMMMSTTPGSVDSFDQYPITTMSTSLKNSRNPPSILPFDRSPGFRNIIN